MIGWTSTGRARLVRSYSSDVIDLRPGERVVRVEVVREGGEYRTLTVIDHSPTRELVDMLAALASGVIDRAVKRWAKRGNGAEGGV